MGVYEVLLSALAVVAVVFLHQAQAREICAGCPVEQDPSGFPTDKLNHALAAAGVNDKVVKVLGVKTQVVAGLKYEVVYESAAGKTCTATWVEAPWESQLPLGTRISCRGRRSLPGGFRDVDASEMIDMKRLAQQAANEGTNGYRRVVINVVKAEKKVVHGMIYKIKYVVKNTSCKMGLVPYDVCMNKEIAPRQVCESTIFTNPFVTHGKPNVEIESTECENLNGFVNIMAAPGKLVDGKDEEELVKAEMHAVRYANQATNSIYYQGLYKIESVKEKLQAGGKLYDIKFQLRNTDCLKGEGLASSEKCHFATDDRTVDTECAVSVWLWPATGYMRVEASACASSKV